MIKKIFGTVRTRVLIAAITLLMVILNARYLGAANVGTISLIILSVTIVQTITNFIGGGAVVYLVPRMEPVNLVVVSYVWAVFSTIVVVVVLGIMKLIPGGYFVHVMILSLIFSFSAVNFMVLLGKERIRAYNNITLLQVLLLFGVLLFFLFIAGRRDAMIYVYGLYASYLFIFLSSLVIILPYLDLKKAGGLAAVIREILRYGTAMQVGNILQLFNYRLGLYLMEFFLGRAAVGIYSVGAQISEGIWIIPRSISLVQFSRISNTEDKEYAARLTMNFIKIGTILAFFAVLILLVLPGSFFSLLFGREFTGIRMVIASLAMGIVSLSGSIILSSYFSGIGKPYHNATGSAIGLVFTVVLGILLIPRIGIVGAGLAATASYSAATLYQLIVFIRCSGLKRKDYLLTLSDIKRVMAEIKGKSRPVQVTK